MGNKSSKRRVPVEEQFTRPQGLYAHRDVDHKKLKRLILDAKLAPCYPGIEEASCTVEECPICFMYYPSLNRSKCCGKGICTECFLQMKSPNVTRPMQCPFCKTPTYSVEYRGAKTLEERGREQEEEQLVIEAKIRMQQEEQLADEERKKARENGLPPPQGNQNLNLSPPVLLRNEASNIPRADSSRLPPDLTSPSPDYRLRSTDPRNLFPPSDPTSRTSDPSSRIPWIYWNSGESRPVSHVSEGGSVAPGASSNFNTNTNTNSSDHSDSPWFRSASWGGSGGIQPNHLLASGSSPFRSDFREGQESGDALDLLSEAQMVRNLRGSGGSVPGGEGGPSSEGLGWLRVALSPDGGESGAGGNGYSSDHQPMRGNTSDSLTGEGRSRSSVGATPRWMRPTFSNSSASDEEELEDVEELMMMEAILQSLGDAQRTSNNSSEPIASAGSLGNSSTLDGTVSAPHRIGTVKTEHLEDSRLSSEPFSGMRTLRGTGGTGDSSLAFEREEEGGRGPLGGWGGSEVPRNEDSTSTGQSGSSQFVGSYLMRGLKRHNSTRLPTLLSENSANWERERVAVGRRTGDFTGLSNLQLPDLLKNESTSINRDVPAGNRLFIPDLLSDESTTQTSSSAENSVSIPDLLCDEPTVIASSNLPTKSSRSVPDLLGGDFTNLDADLFAGNSLLSIPDLLSDESTIPNTMLATENLSFIPHLLSDESTVSNTNLLSESIFFPDPTGSVVALPDLMGEEEEEDTEENTAMRLESFLFSGRRGGEGEDGEELPSTLLRRSEGNLLEDLDSIPQSYEDQLALAMALSLTEAEAQEANRASLPPTSNRVTNLSAERLSREGTVEARS